MTWGSEVEHRLLVGQTFVGDYFRVVVGAIRGRREENPGHHMHILLLQQSNHFNHYPEGYQEHVALKTTHLEKEGGFKSEPERS